MLDTIFNTNQDVPNGRQLLATSLAGALVYFLFKGLYAPTWTEFQILPRVHRLIDPTLFSTDPVFGVAEPQFFLVAWAYRLLGMAMPLLWASVVMQFANYTLLVAALVRFSSVLAGRAIHVFVVVAVLLAGGHYLIAGHHLTHATFYTQYGAYAAVLMGFSFLLEQRLVAAMSWATIAMLLYPLAGLLGIGAMGLVFLLRPSFGPGFIASMVILVSGVAAGLLPSILAYPAAGDVDVLSYLNTMKLVSQGHFNPMVWGAFPYLHVIMLALFGGAYLYYIPSRPEYRRPLTGLWIYLVGCVVITVANNTVLMQPTLFIASPIKAGPIMLGLSHVCVVVLLAQRLHKGLALSSIVPLFATHWSTFLPQILMLLLADALIRKKNSGWSTEKYDLCLALACTLLFIPLFVPVKGVLSGLGTISSISPLFNVADSLRTLAVLLPALFLVRRFGAGRSQAVVGGIALAGMALFGTLGGTFPKGVTIEPRDVAKSDLCAFVERNIPKDATVIVPPLFDRFQALSKRSAFITRMHVARAATGWLDWQKRMKLIHALPEDCCNYDLNKWTTIPKSLYFTIDRSMEQRYSKLTENDFNKIRGMYPDTQFCVVKHGQDLDYKLMYDNGVYALYKIIQK